MTQESDNPKSGGSYVRDPKTGALARVEETAPPAEPNAPAKTTERKDTTSKAAPEKSAVETKE